MVDFDSLREEYSKCFNDKSRVYMIKNYLKTYDATQQKDVAFNLFPRQIDMCQTLGNANNVVTTKSRQMGITTTFAGFISCEMALADPESPQTVLCIGNTLDLAQQMLGKIKAFLLQFPLWIWGDEYIEGRNAMEPPENQNIIFKSCNSKEIKLKNGCRIIARSSGPNASRGVGGVTWLCFDEAAFIENGQDVYTSALPTVSTGGHIIMISTPNGKDQLYYETCRRAILKGTKDWNNFELVKMIWYQDPRYNKFLEWTKRNEDTGEVEVRKMDYIDKDGNVRYEPEAWEKLKDEGWNPRSPWYIKMCRQFNNDRQKIAQELDVSFLGSAANVVEPQFIEMQAKLNQREPLYTDNIEPDTWVWKEPIPGHRYIMSIDNSRGDAADRTALEIIDMDGVDENGEPIVEQVLEYHGKKAGDVVGEMANIYGLAYNGAFCVVDCIGGTGDACVLTLRNLKYKNLYYDDPDMRTYMIEREVSSVKLTPEGKLPGFHTNAVRYQMLTNFANMVKTNQFKIRSSRVINELDTWIYKGKEGRIDHQDGCHDDTLTCLAMALWIMNISFKKIEAMNNSVKMTLRAMVAANSNVVVDNRRNSNEIWMTPGQEKKNIPLPFYTNTQLNKKTYSPYQWLTF